jgi:hypothetical protein
VSPLLSHRSDEINCDIKVNSFLTYERSGSGQNSSGYEVLRTHVRTDPNHIYASGGFCCLFSTAEPFRV